MNWTGGRLQRHSGPAKGLGELTHHQQLHFAKARARICHGQLNPQTFAAGPSNFFCADPASTHQIQPLTKRPRTLHQHETASSVAHQRSFIEQTRLAHHESSKRGRLVDVAGEGATPIRSHRNESHQLALQTAQTKTLQMDQCNDDDRSHSQLGSRGNKNFDSSSARLKAEKARLLKSRDWVGLASSRPLHLAFATSNKKQDMGKRHKVKRKKDSKPVEQKTFHATMSKRAREDNGPSMSGTILDDDDIRINIGENALAPQSLLDNDDMHGMSRSAASSDEMLFDVEARRETRWPQDDEFRGNNVATCSSVDEQAKMQCAAGHSQPDHASLDNLQPINSHVSLTNVEELLQRLGKMPSRSPSQHEYGSSAAYAVTRHHASPHELEKDNVDYQRMHEDNVTMQSHDYENIGKAHSVRQIYGQSVSDSGTTRNTLSPPLAYLAGRFIPHVLDPEKPKAILLQENDEVRSGGSKRLLHEANGNTEAVHMLDDIAWRKFLQVKSDKADQQLTMQQSNCGSQGAHDGGSSPLAGAIDESCHVRSGGLATYTESAARPIGDGCRMHDRELEQEYHSTVRNIEGPAAGDANGAFSNNLRLQLPVSSAVAAAAKTGSPAVNSHQTERSAKHAAPCKEMISDADVDAAETIWKRFVLGSDPSEAQYGQCKSPERALRSTAASIDISECGSFSSLSVGASVSFASAPAPFQPL